MDLAENQGTTLTGNQPRTTSPGTAAPLKVSRSVDRAAKGSPVTLEDFKFQQVKFGTAPASISKQLLAELKSLDNNNAPVPTPTKMAFAQLSTIFENLPKAEREVLIFPDFSPEEWKAITNATPLGSLMPTGLADLDPVARELHITENMLGLVEANVCKAEELLRIRQIILADALTYRWYLARYFFWKMLTTGKVMTSDEKALAAEQYKSSHSFKKPKPTLPRPAPKASNKKKKPSGRDRDTPMGNA